MKIRHMLLLTVMSVLMLCLCAGETLAVASDLPNESPVPIANAQWITADRPDTAAGTAQQTRSPGVHVSGSDRSPDACAVPLPIFRKSFMVKDGPISKAELVICGLGHFELSINGTRVGDHFLDPPWSDYADTCYTVRFDVADLLTPGENVLGVMLGNGMYNVMGGRYTKFTGSYGPPKLTLCLAISQGDTQQIINSDAAWKTDAGPITFSCIYGGEDYDARREQPGWDGPGFDDSLWKPVTVVDGPGGALRPATCPPVKVIRHLEPVSITKLKDGRYEVDLGENLSARPVIQVKGKAGSRVTIETAEQKGKPWKGHSYRLTLKGDAESEVFAPRFTYFGFQYLYVSGVAWGDDISSTSAVPALIEIGADFVSSCGPRIGAFACSNSLLNDIDDMIDRSVTSNLQHVLTDCPHREKLGWLEVSHLMGPSILLNYDMGELYRKICRDTTDSQLENGLVPDIAPEYVRFNGGFFESPEWGSAAVQLPWLLYRWYGDEAILREQYSTMARYTEYLAGTRNDLGLVKGGLGDWYDWTPEKGHVGSSQLTPNELPATTMLYDNARILWQAATMERKVADTRKWKALMQAVRRDFLAAYYDSPNKTVATGSQCALALGLYFGLVPEQDRDAVVANLVKNLEENQYRQSTGEVSFRYLVLALAEAGRSDVVYRMINRTDAPGYGCMLKQHGLQTLSERWDRPGSSLNHCMFGHIQEWFQKYVLGIRQVPGSTGYEKVLIDPFIPDDLDWAAGSFDSPNGRIEVAWARKGSIVEVTIEAEKAEVIVPPGRRDVRWKVNKKPIKRDMLIPKREESNGPVQVPLDTAKEKVDWPAFMRSHDMIFDKLPQNWTEAPHFGNAMIGSMLYQADDTLRLQVFRADVHDHRDNTYGWTAYSRPRLQIGHFSLNTVGKLTGCSWRKDLWNAELTGTIYTDKGQIKIRHFTHAKDMAIVTELTPSAGEQACRWTWHPVVARTTRGGYPTDQAGIERFAKGFGKHHAKTLKVFKANPAGRQEERGPVSVWVQDFLVGGQYATAWQEQVTNQARTHVVSIAHTYPESTAADTAVADVTRCVAQDRSARVDSHRTWWHDYYPRSFVTLPDKGLESLYWQTIYRFGCTARAGRCIVDTAGLWFQGQSWPYFTMDWNIQSALWPVYAANRLEQGQALVDRLYEQREALIAAVRPVAWQADSAHLPVAVAWDMQGSRDGDMRYYDLVGNLPWVMHNMWWQYRFSMDDKMLRDKIFPLLRRSINPYLHMVQETPDGTLRLPPTFSPEMGVFADCNFDLALFKWGCHTLLKASERLGIADPLIPRWRDVTQRLVDYPFDEYGFMLGRDRTSSKNHQHFSNLLMIYPLYLVNVEQADTADVMRRSFERALGTAGPGQRQAMVQAHAGPIGTAQGLGDEALKSLKLLQGDLYPNGLWYKSPCIESTLALANIIQDMLIQSWSDPAADESGPIRIFPATPSAWKDIEFHDLRTEGAFLVSAKRTAGQTQWIRIKSLVGEPCRVRPDMAGQVRMKSDRTLKLKQVSPGLYEIDLKKDEEVLLY